MKIPKGTRRSRGSVVRYRRRWAFRRPKVRGPNGEWLSRPIEHVFDTREDAETFRDLWAEEEAIASSAAGTVGVLGQEWIELQKPDPEDYAGDPNPRALRNARHEWESMRGHWRRVEQAAFIDWPVSAVTQRAVMTWVEEACMAPIERGNRNVGERPRRQTIQHGLNTLRGFYKWAVHRGHSQHNPALGVTIRGSIAQGEHRKKMPRHAPEEAHSTVAVEVVRAIIEDPRPSLMQKAYWLAIAFSGCRPGALLELTWDRVDLEAGTITLRRKNRDANRFDEYTAQVLSFGLEALRAFAESEAARVERGVLVFHHGGEAIQDSGGGMGWNDRRKTDRGTPAALKAQALADKGLSQRQIAAALDVSRTRVQQLLRTRAAWNARFGTSETLYSLKHTFASMLVVGHPLWVGEGGEPWQRDEIQPQLGHKSPASTDKYIRTLSAKHVAAAKRSRAAFKRKPPTLRLVHGDHAQPAA